MTNKCPYCNKEITIELKTKDKPVKASKNGKIFCQVCAKEIVPVDVEIKGDPRHFEPEQIVWYSQKEFGKNICWSCQNEDEKDDDAKKTDC